MSFKNDLIGQNVKRIVQLLPVIDALVTKIDLGASNVYDRTDTIDTIRYLSDALSQMDCDLEALSSLLEDS